jgi:hypothetical protein
MFNPRAIAVSLILVTSISATAVTLAVAAPADEEQAATVAKSWLAMVDKGEVGRAWDQSAPLLKTGAPKQQFVKQVKGVRDMFGKVVSRTLKSKTYTKSVPGAPDGEYVMIQFDTSFEKKKDAVETITPMKDKGQWKVSGYYIK